MKNKKNFWKIFGKILGIASFIAVLYGIYQNREKNAAINIEKSENVFLTAPLNIDGLKATYTLGDSIELENIWCTKFVLINTGEKTIIESDFPRRTIRRGYIPYSIDSCLKVLSAKITKENNGAKDTLGGFYFSQWRPYKFMEITVISEGETSPTLTISEHEIIDINITKSVYEPVVYKPKMIDKVSSLEKLFLYVLYWGIAILITIVAIRKNYLDIKKEKEVSGKSLEWTDGLLAIFYSMLVIDVFLIPLLWMF